MSAFVLIVMTLASGNAVHKPTRTQVIATWPTVTMQRFESLEACQHAKLAIYRMAQGARLPGSYCAPASNGPELDAARKRFEDSPGRITEQMNLAQPTRDPIE